MLLAWSPGQETTAVYQCRISSVAFAALTSFSSHGGIWKLREEEEIRRWLHRQSLIFGLKPPSSVDAVLEATESKILQIH